MTNLEKEIERLWPGVRLAVVRALDRYKDEQLVVVTEKQNAGRDELTGCLRERGYAEESIPKKVLVVHKLPLLDSGETDYPKLTELVARRCERLLCPVDRSIWK